MTNGNLRAGLPLLTVLLLLQGCESTDGTEQSINGNDQGDVFIDDIPMIADSFVMSTFQLDADGEPVSIESVELIKE